MICKLHSIPLFIAVLFICSCSAPKETAKSDKPAKNTENTMDTIVINALGDKEYRVKVGDIISYSAIEHGSVGITFDFEIISEQTESEKKILILTEKKRVYKNEEMNNPDPNAPVMTGADEAVVSLFFKAAEKGTAKLKVTEYFRGTVTNSCEFEILVE